MRSTTLPPRGAPRMLRRIIATGGRRGASVTPTWPRHLAPRISSAADMGAFGDMTGQPRPEGLFDKPFPRMREGNPYRLLGVAQEASFEEIQDARNYLYEQYKWHEESREAIEGAFEKLLKKNLQERFKTGFAPPRFGRRGQRLAAPRQRTLLTKLQELIDPTVTSRTLVNEGAVFGAFAFWALFSSDQSFPLAATFAYSVYQFQSKRVKRDPEGPFLGGNAIVGAIMTTLLALAIGCGVMALVTAPLATMLERSARQVGGFITVAVMGLCGIYLK